LKEKQRQRLIRKLDTAEAFNLAYVGSRPSKGKKNMKAYERWQKKQIKKIAELEGRKIKTQTVWDALRRNKRKGKRSRKFK
jgi:hypothetical protein